MMSLQPGTHLDPYEMAAPRGVGAMGEVYRVQGHEPEAGGRDQGAVRLCDRGR